MQCGLSGLNGQCAQKDVLEKLELKRGSESATIHQQHLEVDLVLESALKLGIAPQVLDVGIEQPTSVQPQNQSSLYLIDDVFF